MGSNSKKNRKIGAVEIVFIILAVLQVVFLIIFRVLLTNGYIAAKLIEFNRYDKAIEIIQKNHISDKPVLRTQVETDLQYTLSNYVDEKISYEDAYSMIHRYDVLADLNYNFNDSETLRLFNEIHTSREDMNKADDSRKIEYNKAGNLAKAINYYDMVSSADTKYYSEISEKRDSTMTEFEDHLENLYNNNNIKDVLEEIDQFLSVCQNVSCIEQCSELQESYISKAKSDFDLIVSSYESKSAYKKIINTIELYQDYFFDDKEYLDTLKQRKGEYIVEWINHGVNVNSYSGDTSAFGVAETYDSEYPGLKLIDSVCESYKGYVNKLIKNKEYTKAETILKNNRLRINKYESKLGFTYNDKLLNVYKKWCESKKNSHEYLEASDGNPAIKLAEKANDLSEGSIDINDIISEAKEYEENQLVMQINEQRKSNGIIELTRYSVIDDISNELVIRLKNGEEEFDDFWDVANRYDINDFYTTRTTAYSDGQTGRVGVTVTTPSVRYVKWRYIPSASYFLEYCSDSTAELFYEDAQYTKIGVGTSYDENSESFCWFICLFT